MSPLDAALCLDETDDVATAIDAASEAERDPEPPRAPTPPGTYGRLSYDRWPARRYVPEWVMTDVAPHVALKLKAVFPRIDKAEIGRFTFEDSPAVGADLDWFLHRYPMEMSLGDRRRLTAAKKRFDQSRAEIDTILLPEWRPRTGTAMRPGKAPFAFQEKAIEIATRLRRLLVLDEGGMGNPKFALVEFDEQPSDGDVRSLQQFLRRWSPRGTPRCGDVVVHNPSDEAWVVAYVDGDRLAACGWPFGEVPLADCTRVTACTRAEHRAMLEQVAGCDDKRGRMAREALEALAAADARAGETIAEELPVRRLKLGFSYEQAGVTDVDRMRGFYVADVASGIVVMSEDVEPTDDVVAAIKGQIISCKTAPR